MHFFNNKSDQKERVKTHNHKGQLCGLNRESPCFVLAFCGSALAPPAPCSEGGTAWIDSFIFPPSSCSLEDHSLSPVNSIFIILEKPGKKKKKACLEVFPYQQTSQCGLCSQKYVEISQVFLTADFPVPSPAICLQMGADSAWDDLPVLQISLCPAWFTGSVQDL